MTPALAIAPPPSRTRNRLRILTLALAGLGGASVGLVVAQHPRWWWALAPTAALLLAATFGGRLRSSGPEGSRGDRRIAARAGRAMAALPRAGFDVIHNLPGRRGLVEHVLVGPTGIFAVACGNGPEASWRAARGAVEIRRRLRSVRLSIPVRGVAVGGVATEPPVPGVSRLRPGDLVPFVSGLARQLSDLQIERAMAAILEEPHLGLRPASF
jgi:hypothetical protein